MEGVWVVGRQVADIADSVKLRDVAMATIFCRSIYGVYIGATWRIRLNRMCAAAMRLYIKLRWPLVISSRIAGIQLDLCNFTRWTGNACDAYCSSVTSSECKSTEFKRCIATEECYYQFCSNRSFDLSVSVRLSCYTSESPQWSESASPHTSPARRHIFISGPFGLQPVGRRCVSRQQPLLPRASDVSRLPYVTRRSFGLIVFVNFNEIYGIQYQD